MNRDVTYCRGKKCNLRQHCVRFKDGERIMNDDGSYWWMDHCDEETRDGYIKEVVP